MKKIFFLVMIVLLPVCSRAAYKIYLNNGSEISGVNSYDEAGDQVSVYFSTGSMVIPKKNILKIEGNESAEPEAVSKKGPETRPEIGREMPRETTTSAPSPAVPQDDKSARKNELRVELDSVNSDIRSAEEQEAKLTATINEKTGSRTKYNLIQLKQLEKELEPLRHDLSAVQQKKVELVNRKSGIEAELKSLE